MPMDIFRTHLLVCVDESRVGCEAGHNARLGSPSDQWPPEPKYFHWPHCARWRQCPAIVVTIGWAPLSTLQISLLIWSLQDKIPEPKLSEIASLQLEVGAVLTVDCGLHEYQHDHVNTGHTGHQCHTCSADTGPNLSRTRGQIQGKNSQPLFAASRSQWRFGKWLN